VLLYILAPKALLAGRFLFLFVFTQLSSVQFSKRTSQVDGLCLLFASRRPYACMPYVMLQACWPQGQSQRKGGRKQSAPSASATNSLQLLLHLLLLFGCLRAGGAAGAGAGAPAGRGSLLSDAALSPLVAVGAGSGFWVYWALKINLSERPRPVVTLHFVAQAKSSKSSLSLSSLVSTVITLHTSRELCRYFLPFWRAAMQFFSQFLSAPQYRPVSSIRVYIYIQISDLISSRSLALGPRPRPVLSLDLLLLSLTLILVIGRRLVAWSTSACCLPPRRISAVPLQQPCNPLSPPGTDVRLWLILRQAP
jgi:hypothetical protein